MKLKSYLILACALLVTAGQLSAAVISNDRITIPFDYYVDCANDGAGEWVLGDLRLHIVLREQEDAAGGFHYGFHYQPMGGALVGEDTNLIYRTTGVTQEAGYIGVNSLPMEFTYVEHGVFASRGKAPNLNSFILQHVTINELGELTVETFVERITCN